MSIRRMFAGLLIVVAGAAKVISCGSNSVVATVALTYSRFTTAMQTMPEPDKNGDPTPLLRWSSADQLILTTWGSGTCPLLPTAVTLQNAHRISISLASVDGPCTADLAPTNSVIVAPAGLDASMPAIAKIRGNEVALAPRK